MACNNLRERLARNMNNPEEKAMIMAATTKDLLLNYCKGILSGRLVVGLTADEKADLKAKCEDVLREYGELGSFHFLNPPKEDKRDIMKYPELFFIRPSWEEQLEIAAWNKAHKA